MSEISYLEHLDELLMEGRNGDVDDVVDSDGQDAVGNCLKSPPRKALRDLTYTDIFGSPESPEKKKRRKSDAVRDRSKADFCGSSSMAQLGVQPVEPTLIKSSFTSVDTTPLLIDHFSRIRLFKTSIALYHDDSFSVESALKERNFGLQYVSLLGFGVWYRTKGKETKNFWTSGILVRKQPGIRKSAKGNEYVLWEINDLKELDKCWTIFLFSSAVNAPSLSEIPVGSLIDIITPSVLDSNKGGSSVIKFSINNSNQIRLVGTAKDFGFCQSKRKKDGQSCNSVVNTWECCTCIYHASSELKKMNGKKKQDGKAGASFPKRNNLFDMPPAKANSNPNNGEKVFTVNFGKPNSVVPSKAGPVNRIKTLPNTRMELQGSGVYSELKRMSGTSSSSSNHFSVVKEKHDYASKLPASDVITKPVLNLDPLKTRHLTDKDRAILAALSSPSKQQKVEGNKNDKTSNKSAPQQFSAGLASRIVSNPNAASLNFMKFLSSNNGQEDEKRSVHDTRRKELEPITMTRETVKNMKKALQFVRSNGPIVKTDPNSVSKRKSLSSGTKAGQDQADSCRKVAPKRKSVIEVEFDFESDEFKKVLNAKSAHEEHTNDMVQQEYFNTLEKKEAIENKLLNTYHISTNGVMCKQCKYVALSQSDYCKEMQHSIRVVKANKRFFKCKDCGNRTMSLDRLPKNPCKQCNNSSWLPAPVGKEKTGPILPTEVLSIRGNEESFLGTSSSKMFLNLEV